MNDPVFSFLKKGGGGGSQVFNVFLKGVPNSNSLYHIKVVVMEEPHNNNFYVRIECLPSQLYSGARRKALYPHIKVVIVGFLHRIIFFWAILGEK
jgi:hypothetical protein